MMEEMDDNEVLRSIRPTTDFTVDANGKMVVPSLPPTPYIKKGILSKKGMGKVIRPWVLRTVVLDRGHHLLYYDGTKLRGEISLDGTVTRPVEADLADGRPFAFEVSNISGVKKHQNTTLLLAASSQNDAKDWVDVLNSAAASTPARKSNDVAGYTTFEEASATTKPLDLKKIKENRQKAHEEKQREYGDFEDEEEEEEEGSFN